MDGVDAEPGGVSPSGVELVVQGAMGPSGTVGEYISTSTRDVLRRWPSACEGHTGEDENAGGLARVRAWAER